MTETIASRLNQLPPEMLDFTILKTSGALSPRLGRLSLPGRKTILTPAFLGNTSRGVVPHISQDNFRKYKTTDGVYIALEDCKRATLDAHVVFRIAIAKIMQLWRNIRKRHRQYSNTTYPNRSVVSSPFQMTHP
jgi:hypothetical protein